MSETFERDLSALVREYIEARDGLIARQGSHPGILGSNAGKPGPLTFMRLNTNFANRMLVFMKYEQIAMLEGLSELASLALAERRMREVRK